MSSFTESTYREYFEPKNYLTSEISNDHQLESLTLPSTSWTLDQSKGSFQLSEQNDCLLAQNTKDSQIEQLTSYPSSTETYVATTGDEYFYSSLEQPVFSQCSQEASDYTSQVFHDFEIYSHQPAPVQLSPIQQSHNSHSPPTFQNSKIYEPVSTGNNKQKEKQAFDITHLCHYHQNTQSTSVSETLSFLSASTEPPTSENNYLPSIQGLTLKQLLDQETSQPLFEESLHQVGAFYSGHQENENKASQTISLDTEFQSTLNLQPTSQTFSRDTNSYSHKVDAPIEHCQQIYTHQPAFVPTEPFRAAQILPELVNISTKNSSSNSFPMQKQTSSANPTPDHPVQRPRRYPCSVEGCSKTFNRSDELNRHLRVHTGMVLLCFCYNLKAAIA